MIDQLHNLVTSLESQLATCQARFQSIVQYNVDGLILVDQEGRIRFVNPAAERILCRSADKLIGEPLGLPILVGETVELDLLCPGGEIKTAEMRASNTVWDGPAFLISLRDTSERRQAEAQIRFQAQLLNSVEQAVIATDLQSRITYLNHAAEKLYGWSAQEAIGQNILDLIPTDQSYEQAAAIMAALRDGASWSGEFLVRDRQGRTFPVLATDSPVYDRDGNLIGVVGVSTDIGERKQIQDRILHLNAVLKAIRNVSRLITREKDPDRLLYGVCNALVKTRGFRSAWIARLQPDGQFKSFVSVGNEEGLSCLDERMRDGYVPPCITRALETDEPVILNECIDCPGNAHDSRVYKMSVRLAHEGHVYGVLTVALSARSDHVSTDEEEKNLFAELANDVAFALYSLELENHRRASKDALQQAFELLREREQSLQEALREKETMLAEIHHRVKNNLQVVAGLLDFQAQYLQDAQAVAALQSCRDRVYTMSLIHEQLYESASLTRVDVREYIHSIITELLATHYHPDRPVEVDIQVDRLEMSVRQAIPCGMLIGELISNVFKHAFPPSYSGRPSLGIFMGLVEPNICRVTVSDNGVGLPSDFRFPSDATLGMFLVDTLVKQLRGKILWQSQNGTTCYVEFELIQEAAEKIQHKAARTQGFHS